ncbi:corepressor interacting with RBPJ 1 [Daktulosphaira vitifoliae]|uniref:corepressor interacting with RBPJ 1 n=1 Tax=Daktulosphaira vitifoliae TaxID=58002 RepID=UPI0021AAEF18|nr:corepressor interacting with RBPJ 1 [Daktulosphaira vitifoliae]
MGKGFNNYMCKKFFHPASRDNLKRVWMAEQKSEKDKKRQEELRLQYEKEQDLYNNKALLSKESKDKLSVNFMYEPPPGAKKEREREDNEPEYKFEWQRKFNAPREDYCKGDQEIRDQPFGIQVRNVRCIKCHKWGHINTDKECPLFNQASISEAVTSVSANGSSSNMKTQDLIKQMREDGLALKKSAASTQQQISCSNNGADSDSELFMYIKSLTRKKKIKLLKRLDRMDRIMMKEQRIIMKQEVKSMKKKRRNNSSSSRSSSNSSN